MGYNATMIIMSDALEDIRKDTQFGKKVSDAVSKLERFGKPVDISSGVNVNAASVIEEHHANNTRLIAVGGNYATVLSESYMYTHHKKEFQIEILKDFADKMGYDIVKK